MSTTSTPAPGLVGGHVALDLVNTVSWRLRTARQEFERMVLRRLTAERSGGR